ncbi:hypothetical protein CENSYa_0699 [Cenarchaeum symbiosum A]|uniref:Uncharacterized protein n=1 Tax=Cenarchaeum symbiosum (strain A) TaxID=414004 RepID=A0RVG5_CENSY|nr:hypothetical protein CENSYa_0699 [Cenarchaeum symbiosum A]
MRYELLLLAACIYIPLAEAGDAPCRPWVEGRAVYDVTIGGLPRNNPDNTVYPGDALRYVFNYGFEGQCYSTRVHPVVFSGAHSYGGGEQGGSNSGGGVLSGISEILIHQANGCHGGGPGGINSWDTSWGEAISCGSISLTVSAVEIHCVCGAGGCKCTSFVRTRTATITPESILAPIVELDLQQHTLTDPLGYMASNHDWTAYPWDPLTLEHIAKFEHRDDREGTITFRYDRTFAPLEEEGGYECDRICRQTLEEGIVKVPDGAYPVDITGTGFEEYPWESENGGGMYAYTAPDRKDAGLHHIEYDMSVLNLGRVINTNSNWTDRLFAEYSPVYAHYDYTVLSDGEKYAYDDRHGVLLYYAGSNGTGPGDEPGMHEARRSRLDSYDPITTMYSEGFASPGGAPPILITPGMAARYGSSAVQWDSIGWINGTNQTGWNSTGDHAMFEDEGYGLVRFSQNISGIILDPIHWDRWYYNTTIYNKLGSDGWAGYEHIRPVNYTYQYPHTPFAAWFNMTLYSGAGGLAADAAPRNITHDSSTITIHTDEDRISMMLDEYLYAKTLHDTGDENFSRGIVDEAYTMDNAASGDRSLSMWMNKTALEWHGGFDAHGAVLYEEPVIFGSTQEDITPSLRAVPLGAVVLDSPRYASLDSDAPMGINMSAGDASRTIYLLREFHLPHTEHVTAGEGALYTARAADTSTIRFWTDHTFGDIQHASLDGRYIDVETACDHACTITSHEGGAILVTNAWGGTASHVIEQAEPRVPPDAYGTISENIWAIAYVAAAGIAMYVIIKAAARAARDVSDAEPAEQGRG